MDIEWCSIDAFSLYSCDCLLTVFFLSKIATLRVKLYHVFSLLYIHCPP